MKLLISLACCAVVFVACGGPSGAQRGAVAPPICAGTNGEACRIYIHGTNDRCIDGNTGREIVEGCCPAACAPLASQPEDFWCYEGGTPVMEGQPPPCPPRRDGGSEPVPQP